MNTLIVVGLMAFGLLAIIAAIFLATDESKTAPSSTTASLKTESRTTSAPQIGIAPTHVAAQRLPALREDAQVATITTQFSDLTVQLRSLHEQAQEVERRLSVLADLAEHIESGQTRVSIEETEEYRLPEPADGARA